MKKTKAKLPTKYGDFDIHVWDEQTGLETVVLVTKGFDPNKDVLMRIHSECLTGDIFGSKRCECGEQLEVSLSKISESKNGMFVYLRQEGRGIGLFNKIKTYKLQEEGMDTYDSCVELGFDADEREYSFLSEIVKEFNLENVSLLTNNPDKIKALESNGVSVQREPLLIKTNADNKKYMDSKKEKFDHLIPDDYE